jgi:prepilin signal peptidase PulO-like enzyme (type II secretory pathway)
MTQNIPVAGSAGVSEGCRTGRSQRRPRVTALVILLLVLIVSQYLLLVSDVAMTTLSATLATILLVMDIADRLSILPIPRRL